MQLPVCEGKRAQGTRTRRLCVPSVSRTQTKLQPCEEGLHCCSCGQRACSVSSLRPFCRRKSAEEHRGDRPSPDPTRCSEMGRGTVDTPIQSSADQLS